LSQLIRGLLRRLGELARLLRRALASLALPLGFGKAIGELLGRFWRHTHPLHRRLGCRALGLIGDASGLVGR